MGAGKVREDVCAVANRRGVESGQMRRDLGEGNGRLGWVNGWGVGEDADPTIGGDGVAEGGTRDGGLVELPIQQRGVAGLLEHRREALTCVGAGNEEGAAEGVGGRESCDGAESGE